ncbi:MAG: hypothetical protein ACYS14_13550, partial [Planctomycetota bacterium]
MKIIITTLTALMLLIPGSLVHGQGGDLAKIERISKSGATLGAEITSRFPLAAQTPENDTGINVL